MSSTVVQYNGEGDGTPLQYSCLENPMDGGAWWTAVHGVKGESYLDEQRRKGQGVVRGERHCQNSKVGQEPRWLVGLGWITVGDRDKGKSQRA